MMIYLIVFLLALLNSVMDVLKDKFSSSIFQNLDSNFWNPNISWKRKYRGLDPKMGRKYFDWLSGFADSFSDAWHIAKLLFILLLITGLSVEKSFSIYYPFIFLGIWGLTFKMFYSKILIK